MAFMVSWFGFSLGFINEEKARGCSPSSSLREGGDEAIQLARGNRIVPDDDSVRDACNCLRWHADAARVLA